MNREVNPGWFFRKKAPIEAMRLGDSIAIPPRKPLVFLERYFHEAGHIIGWNLSFKGLEVLTPDEAKIAKVENMDPETKAKVIAALRSNKPGQEELLVDFAKSVLQTYTKGNFDLSIIKVHYNFSEKKLVEIARRLQKKATTYIVLDDGQIKLTSSKKGRDDEIPSYATMRACIKIMENTLGLPEIKYTVNRDAINTSHGRAFVIVDEAYSRSGMILPSYLDMIGKNF